MPPFEALTLMRDMLREYFKRFTLCIAGLLFFGLGNALGVYAGEAGTNAWTTLALGISGASGMLFGTAVLLIGFVVLVIDFFGRGKIGFGTILNMVLVAYFSQIFADLLALLPKISGQLEGSAVSLLGQTVISFATIVYMKARLGCGPRDTLMVLVGNRFPRLPIGSVKFGLELVVLFIGFILGAPLGLGSVLVMALQAAIFQAVCRLCRYEPRDEEHEDVRDTLLRIRGSASN